MLVSKHKDLVVPSAHWHTNEANKNDAGQWILYSLVDPVTGKTILVPPWIAIHLIGTMISVTRMHVQSSAFHILGKYQTWSSNCQTLLQIFFNE